MSTYPVSPEIAQLPLIGVDPSTSIKTYARKKRKVDSTMAKISELHAELNAQLYRNPTERPAVHSPKDVVAIVDPFIGCLDHEELWTVNLDTRNRIMSLVKLYMGSVNSSQVRVCEVFRQAIIENSPGIVVIHNHPSGDTSPSPEDVNLTRALVQAGKLLGIDVLDHIIVSYGRFTSLKERSLGFN
jgi:DNA repair protein RadC